MATITFCLEFNMVGAQGENKAPQWLRESEFCNGLYGEWDSELIKTKFTDFPFIVVEPQKEERYQFAHEHGIKLIPYVTLYNAPMNRIYQDALLNEHEDWIAIDENGEWRKSTFWDRGYPNWYQVCSNTQGFVEHSLKYVKKLMDMGADGVFIDNVHPSPVCYGEKFRKHSHIYPDKDNLYAFGMLLQQIRNLVKSYNPDKVVILNHGSLTIQWKE